LSATELPAIQLARGKERSLLRKHPWIFSGAVDRIRSRIEFGDTVEVFSADGEYLATAAWSPESQIRARVWSFDEDEVIDAAFFRRRIERAVSLRAAAMPDAASSRNACRIVHGESDGLPGLIADRYGDTVVCQLLSAGAERWKDEIVAAIESVVRPRTIYERSDADVRDKEGLTPQAGLLAGSEPAELLEIDENGRRYFVDVRAGHKTGFYLDQRGGRDAAARWCRGREVLNAFSYTGGFAVAALAGGAASVLDADTSAPALELARRCVEANGFGADRYAQQEADVFALLRLFRDSRRSFDAIVLDPPKFVDARSHIDRAARGYKDINLLAFKLLRPGGVLLTFSCSGLLAPDLFQKIVADAAVDARRDVVMVERLGQPADHPVSLAFPESAYLKGLVCLAH
jgi:23S rRNA (cytosine1962-C5)-methyltransferase